MAALVDPASRPDELRGRWRRLAGIGDAQAAADVDVLDREAAASSCSTRSSSLSSASR